jgi:hypothetical protein
VNCPESRKSVDESSLDVSPPSDAGAPGPMAGDENPAVPEPPHAAARRKNPMKVEDEATVITWLPEDGSRAPCTGRPVSKG